VTLDQSLEPSTTASEEVRTPVLAAGVLCWRPVPGGDDIEVLLVHRPSYDDWSFPKGKLETGEQLPVCAVRELAEETGVQAVLGRPLPTQSYLEPATGRTKQVHYWAAVPKRTGRPTAPASEVDQSRWVALARARGLVTYQDDVAMLDHAHDLSRSRLLASAPLIVLRHATSRPRDVWPRADAERPLVASGRRQAISVGELLRCWRPEHVLSSPWRRCVDTLEPYVSITGVKVRTKSGLTESEYRRHPDKVRKHVAGLLERDQASCVCTHRPLLDGVMAELRRACPKPLRDDLPDGDPWLAAGEILVAHVRHRGARPEIVALERHQAPR
jgi:8-oxo-(d)GTP phosphatase